MSTMLDVYGLRELTFDTLAARLGNKGDSTMRHYADYADHFKIRGWDKDADFDADFVKDPEGNMQIQAHRRA